ncbi:Uma2 family endonuclease [Nocardia sp. NPDC004722]
MTEAGLRYHWSREEFVRAWEAGAFDHKAELVEGEVWPVVIGSWHGDTVSEVVGALRHPGVRVSTSTLPTAESLPDPDCWVRHAAAEPVGKIGSRLAIWSPKDVLLVVEVSNETVLQDLSVKAKLYGRAGYDVYWVVTKDTIYEHTEPIPSGYRLQTKYQSGDMIPIRFADTMIAVDSVLHPDE